MKKVVSVLFVILAVSAISLTAFADPATDLATAIPEMTEALGDFSVSNLVTIIVAGLGIAVTLVIFWFAARYLIRKVSGAFRKGKL